MIALSVCRSDGCTVLLAGAVLRQSVCDPVYLRADRTVCPWRCRHPSGCRLHPCVCSVPCWSSHRSFTPVRRTAPLMAGWRSDLTDSRLPAKKAGLDQWHSPMTKQERRSELRSSPPNAKGPLMAGTLSWRYKKSGTPTYEGQYGISETSYYLKHRPDVVLDMVNFCMDCGRVGLNHAYLGL